MAASCLVGCVTGVVRDEIRNIINNNNNPAVIVEEFSSVG